MSNSPLFSISLDRPQAAVSRIGRTPSPLDAAVFEQLLNSSKPSEKANLLTTFVAVLRRQRLTAPVLTDGPIDGEVFLAEVQNFLCPTLQPGDIVVLDNLGSH